jgi:hydrogenase/urease accessory protein HupE
MSEIVVIWPFVFFVVAMSVVAFVVLMNRVAPNRRCNLAAAIALVGVAALFLGLIVIT